MLLAANMCFGWLKVAKLPLSSCFPPLPTHVLRMAPLDHHTTMTFAKITATTTTTTTTAATTLPVSAYSRRVDNRPTP